MQKSRKLWSEKEDNALRREVSKQVANGREVKDWRAPAASLPGRNNKDCRKRWLKLEGPINKGLWSEEENERLREAVRIHAKQWTEVARVVGTRNADQCAKRWLHFLNPELDYSEWTKQEDDRLIAEVETNGRNWRRIVDEVLTGRSATDAKNRYMILERNKKNQENPLNGTAAKPDRRKRPASAISRSGDNGSREEEEPQINNQVDQWATSSVEPMDTLFEDNHFNEAMCTSETFDEMLAHNPDHWLGNWTESKPVDLPQHYAGVIPQNDWHSHPSSFQHLNQPTLRTTTEAGLFRPSSSSRVPFGANNNTFTRLNDASNNERMDLAFSGSESSSVSHSRLSSITRTPTNSSSTSYETSSFVNPVDLGSEQWISAAPSRDGITVKPGNQGNSFPSRERQGSWSVAPSPGRTSSSVSINGYMAGDDESRESRMVIENMQPDLVERVLSLVLTSKSAIDVKIFGQDRNINNMVVRSPE